MKRSQLEPNARTGAAGGVSFLAWTGAPHRDARGAHREHSCPCSCRRSARLPRPRNCRSARLVGWPRSLSVLPFLHKAQCSALPSRGYGVPCCSARCTRWPAPRTSNAAIPARVFFPLRRGRRQTMYDRRQRRLRDRIWAQHFGPGWSERYMTCPDCRPAAPCCACQACEHIFSRAASNGAAAVRPPR